MSLEHSTGFVKRQEPPRDRFLGDRLSLVQPQHGFRAGLDSILLGASVVPGASALLDLGAGSGAAALCAMVHEPGLSATLVDANPQMVALAALNLRTNAFEDRGRALQLDVSSPGKLRTAAGLASDHFASVIANPPYFAEGRGTPAATDRSAARHQPPGALERWVRTAAAHAAPGGEVIFIHVAAALPELVAAFDARLGAVTVLPFTPRPGEAATRVLVRGIKGSRAPFALLASRPVHRSGSAEFEPAIDAILRGEARLVW